MRRASCLLRPLGVLAVAALTPGLAACSSQMAALGTPAHGGATVTFESIDGPPPDVFRKLVTALNEEAGAQNVAVVSRSAPASYRVRSYMSALVTKNKTSFGWVWDVYDGDKNRVLRIAGEEPAASGGRARDAWAVANEQVLHGMSRTGMERLAAFLNSGPPAPSTEPAAGLVLASARDDSPEAAGIVRLFGAEQAQAEASAAQTEAEVPLPPQRPAARKRPVATAAATPPARQSTALLAGR